MPSMVRRNISGQMIAKDSCNRRLEAATISEILHLFGQGNLTVLTNLIQGILKMDFCGYVLYIDDTFTAIHKDEFGTSLHEHLNRQYPSIQLTNVIKENGKIPILLSKPQGQQTTDY